MESPTAGIIMAITLLFDMTSNTCDCFLTNEKKINYCFLIFCLVFYNTNLKLAEADHKLNAMKWLFSRRLCL